MALKQANSIHRLGFFYDKENHVYKLNGKVLQNATGWLGSFSKEFNPLFIAKAVSKSTGVSETRIKKVWNTLGDIGIGLGNAIHGMAHLYYLDKPALLGRYSGVSPHAQVVFDMMTSIEKQFDIIEMEIPRGNKKYLIGYTPDIILRHKTEGYFVVADFKTTKLTDNASYRKEKKDSGKIVKNAPLMAEPFKALKLREVPFDKVKIQLSLYAMLLAEDKTFRHFRTSQLPKVRRAVIHITHDVTSYGGKGYKLFEIPNIDTVVLQALQDTRC